ncbi:hypothetical protein PF008_g30685 [Phytophthora fragariae]|uniref:Uncharacterized protein n=1 Tax=Phytophthora fragariae TaxID=53985 RepID=A0A6G0Q5H6_9STRA|nr:hypothetical protein PF008_g30685 [Phytophthora fragariae]
MPPARAAAMLTISPCCARFAGRRHARHAALAVPATATLAVPLWPGSPECRPPVPPPCSPSRHAALALPAAAMLVMLLSLSPLPLRLP